MSYKRGYSVIEVLLSGSILALAVTAIVASLVIAQRNNQASIAQSQALAMAKEGIEALKSIRDRNYNQLINVNNAALSFNNNEWTINSSPSSNSDQLTNPLRTRRITIANSTTPNSKLVTVTITYQINPEGQTSTVTLSETLANILVSQPTGVTAESSNYRLLDDNFGNMNNSFEDITQ
jgi:Tfp pilus assembly protein PilV